MKKIFKHICLFVITVTVAIGCKRDSDYINSEASPFISNFDLKKAFKEADLTLTAELLRGANSIKGVVISDFTAGNTPAGLLVVQNSRMVGNGIDSVRGMAFNIGSAASNYTIGDSVHIKVEGSILKRVDGVLQITGINEASVNKVASGKNIRIPVVNIARLLASPKTYENTLVTISNTVLEPEPSAGDTFAGNKTISDGFGRAILHTENNASFAGNPLPASANFTGVVYFNSQWQPSLWMRTADDAFELPLVKPSPVIITGYLPDPPGTDASDTDQNEYIQLMATRDIDFAVTPFSVVTTNNAGANTPAGFPTNGWATGGLRTYKINLTSGTVRKGEFFYVGGTSKLIWGISGGVRSTDISNAKWIASVNYTSNDGDDFGAGTSNLLANSGNIAGIAIFEGTTVTVNTVPMDVIMYGGNGQFYSAGPPAIGYRITNTDYYSTVNPSTRQQQLFYGAGSNTNKLAFQLTQANPTGGSFVRLGGVYDAESGRWTRSRSLINVTMSLDSQISELETGEGITVLEN